MRRAVWVSMVVLLSLLLSPTVTTIGTPAVSPLPSLMTSSLFRLVKSVDVTPADSLIGGAFVRVGYVPAKDRIVVTFQGKLDHPKGECAHGFGYSYREFTVDMAETGTSGTLTCIPAPDVGGLFDGNAFYYAGMGRDNKNSKDGWNLIKYDAITWKPLIGPLFHTIDTGEDPGDPMLALVNGQLDISSTYRRDPNAPGGPDKSYATHHQFFAPDLRFISKRILADMPHINLSSMIAVNGVIHFVTGTALLGDLVVMQYDPNWKYLGGKTILPKAACPEGLAFDGKRFYVAYLDDTFCASFPCYQNVHLAAFDPNWNLLEDVAVTSYTPGDYKQTSRPTLTLWKGHIYVAWDQTNDEHFTPGVKPSETDTQVYAKVYELLGP